MENHLRISIHSVTRPVPSGTVVPPSLRLHQHNIYIVRKNNAWHYLITAVVTTFIMDLADTD